MSFPPPRLWILPAKAARVALVLRRGPTKLWRAFVWNIAEGTVQEGDPVWGGLKPIDVDVSWDGRLWIRPGFDLGLSPIARNEPCFQGFASSWNEPPIGYFDGPDSLRAASPPFLARFGIGVPDWASPLRALPYWGNPLHQKWQRDGWRFDERLSAWTQQPTEDHPRLIRRERFSRKRGRHMRYELEGLRHLNDAATSATYDSRGDLLAGSGGWLRLYRFADGLTQEPSLEFDLNRLPAPPHRRADSP